MTLAFSRESIDEMLSKLEKADGWLRSKGIDTTESRFSDILNLTRIIIDHQQRNDIQSLLNVNKGEQLKYVFALIEGFAFAEIYEAFKGQKNHILHKSKLEKMIGGQFFSWDEPSAGNNARNTQFKLETAARFKKWGMEIVGLDDVDFISEGAKFNVQCKRLHSQGRISNNISDAAEQFYTKMKVKPGIKGIISLSIDKLLDKEEMPLRTRNEQKIGYTLAQHSNVFTKSWGNLLQRIFNTNILAALVFVHMVVIMEEEPHDLLTICRNIDLVTLPQNNLEMNDRNLLRKLASKIGATRELWQKERQEG